MKRRCDTKNWLGMVLAKFIRPFGTLVYFSTFFPKNKFLGYFRIIPSGYAKMVNGFYHYRKNN